MRGHCAARQRLGRRRRAWPRRGWVRADVVSRDIDRPRVAPVAPPGRLYGQLDGRGRRRRFPGRLEASAPTPAVASPRPTRRPPPSVRPGYPRIAGSSRMSAGRPPDPPPDAAGVPGANRWRSGGLKVPAGSATRPAGADPPTETGSLGWRSSGRSARRGSMNQRDQAAVAYARDGRLYAMGGFPCLMNKSLTASLMSS